MTTKVPLDHCRLSRLGLRVKLCGEVPASHGTAPVAEDAKLGLRVRALVLVAAVEGFRERVNRTQQQQPQRM
jgi:hypothetical protein